MTSEGDNGKIPCNRLLGKLRSDRSRIPGGPADCQNVPGKGVQEEPRLFSDELNRN